jgi:hypothetical protein
MSGLPATLVDALETVGLNASEIQGLSSYVSSTPLDLAVPSVSGSELLGEAAALQVVVPEPSNLVNVVGAGIAFASYAAWRWWRGLPRPGWQGDGRSRRDGDRVAVRVPTGLI